MDVNKRINNKALIVYLNLLVFFLIGLLYTFFPVAIPEEKNGVFNETRMLISYTFSTGPSQRVLKGNHSIKYLYTEENNYIKLIGNTPAKSLSWEACTDSDFIVYGKITSTTAEFEGMGHGLIPIFYVEIWKPTQYLANIFYKNSQIDFFKMFLFYAFFFILGNMVLGLLILLQVITNKKPRVFS